MTNAYIQPNIMNVERAIVKAAWLGVFAEGAKIRYAKPIIGDRITVSGTQFVYGGAHGSFRAVYLSNDGLALKVPTSELGSIDCLTEHRIERELPSGIVVPVRSLTMVQGKPCLIVDQLERVQRTWGAQAEIGMIAHIMGDSDGCQAGWHNKSQRWLLSDFGGYC